jgi:pimeloyl-ACP methyl ester carboxylesterase
MQVRVVDRGSGPAILFLHGWGGTSATWRKVTSKLSGFRCVTLDFPGFGDSPLPSRPWSVTDYADFTADLISSRINGPAIVVGRSFGGRVAIRLATKYPNLVSKLVLIASAGVTPRSVKSYALGAAAALGRPALESRPVSPFASAIRRAVWAITGSSDYASAGPKRETMKLIVGEDLTSDLRRIGTPTLLIWGRCDRTTPVSDAQKMHRLIPESELHVLQGAGHQVHLDQPNEVARLIVEFLKKGR